jgi:hypothetical protein
MNLVLVELLRFKSAGLKDGIEDRGRATLVCVFERFLEDIRLLPLVPPTVDIFGVITPLSQRKGRRN